jgi:hypothetical protein
MVKLAMGKSIQAHYLPRGAYLSFFEDGSRAGYLHLYQRNKAPVLVSTKKAARERDLYCFRDEHGHLDSSIEAMLAQMEKQASPVLAKLNAATESFELGTEEWGTLLTFVAFQGVRTPAFRRQLRQQYGDLMKAVTQKLASNQQMFKAQMRKLRKEHPETNLDDESLRDFILRGEYDVEFKDSAYFLGTILKSAKDIYPTLLTKKPIILRTESASVVTSDWPVSLSRHPKSPSHWGTGWLNSNITFPIGKRVVLYLEVQLGSSPKETNNPVLVTVRRLAEQRAASINTATVRSADTFLFADRLIKRIARIFDATEQPTRFTVSSHPRFPFIMLRQN